MNEIADESPLQGEVDTLSPRLLRYLLLVREANLLKASFEALQAAMGEASSMLEAWNNCVDITTDLCTCAPCTLGRERRSRTVRDGGGFDGWLTWVTLLR